MAVPLVLILAVAGVVVVGRSGGDDRSEQVTTGTSVGRPPAAVVLAAAPAASRAGGTARIRTTVRSFEGGGPFSSVVEGTVAFDSAAFDLTYSLEAPGAAALGGMSEYDDRIFSDGTTVWSSVPQGIGGGFPGAPKVANPFKGKKYMASPAARAQGTAPGPVGLDAASSMSLGFSIGSAPADVLSYLSSVGSAVEEGVEQIDGEEVVRYGIELDLDALQRALPSDARTFDAYDFKPDVAHRFPGKAWLDRSGRLRKMTYRLDLSVLLTDVALKANYVVEECPDPDPALVAKATAGDRKAVAALATADPACTERLARPEELVTEGSVEVSAYGTPFTVTPPPAAEVVTSDQLDAFLQKQVEAYMPPAPPATKRP